ncbi:hypothetical protein BKI52_45080 [marine bacterium AO1-C]|nr:hypothetical protein BKI52_45080 [marine bacterium AO1-C]
MQTKLERQADKLWEGYKDKSTKFWKKYEQLINASRDAIRPVPVILQSKPRTLDTFTAYAQLPETHYAKLFNKIPFFETSFFPFSLFISMIFGNILFPSDIMIGPVVLFAGFLGLRFWQREQTFDPKRAFFLDIQPDYVQFGTKKEQKRILFKYITGFTMTKKAIKLSAKIPYKGNNILEKTYTIPLRKGKGKRFSTIELNALKQLLDAIMYENKVLKKYKSDAN